MDSSRPPQIIFSLACVSIETHKLSAGPVNIGASGPFNPFAPGDFAEKRVLKLFEWFSGHCRAIKS